MTIDTEQITAPEDAAAELACPLCEYDLRSLIEPRCPECGYRFTWEEIRDPTRRLHPYLFEHHPERSAWSFVRTLLGGLRPRRFWRQLKPQQPANPRRLALYWVLVLAIVLPGLLAMCVTVAVQMDAHHRRSRVLIAKLWLAPGREQELTRWEGELFRAFGTRTIHEYFQSHLPLFPSGWFVWRLVHHAYPRFVLTSLVLVALWPVATVMGMRLMLWVSVRRARVRPIHLARCAVHAADIGAWYFLALGIVAALLAAEGLAGGYSAYLPTPGSNGFRLLIGSNVALLVAFPVACYRLIIASRTYLRLPHAGVVVVLTQLVIVLVMIMAVHFAERLL